MDPSSGMTRLLKRCAALALVLAALIGLPDPVPAGAFTQLGDTAPEATANCPNGAGDNLVQPFSQPSPGPGLFPFSYTVAEPGVIVRWFHAGPGGEASAGSGRLLVWRPTENFAPGDRSGNEFRLVGESDREQFAPGTALTWPVRIPVLPGDVLGLRAESDTVGCTISRQPDGFRFYNGPNPAEGSTHRFGAERANRQVNVSANMEADPDQDGWGNESQDFCPDVTGPDNGCPLPPPEEGETGNAFEVSGTVRIKLPGSNEFVTLDGGESLPIGTLFDTRRGEVRLDTETRTNTVRTAFLSRGTFRLLQQRRDGFITNYRLTPIGAANRRQGFPDKNTLFAKAGGKGWGKGGGKGHQTTGNHGSGSVRGTKWLTSEIRAGTRFEVFEGQVRVRDFGLDRTIVLEAGESYLARAD